MKTIEIDENTIKIINPNNLTKIYYIDITDEAIWLYNEIGEGMELGEIEPGQILFDVIDKYFKENF